MSEGSTFDREQHMQEEEYAFPYHHVVQGRDGFSQCFNDGWGINYLATVEFILEQVRAESFASAIDIGCGDGRLTKELAESFPGTRVLGVDYSRRAVTLAKAMAPNCEFRCVDITAENLAEQFDLAVLMEVYEHIPPEAAPGFSAAVARLVPTGGKLIVTVPHVNKRVEPKHYRHFRSGDIEREFGDWFERVETIPIERISLRKTLIDRSLTNPLFVVHNRRIGRLLFDYYRKRLFLAGREERCQRIIVRLRRK